jgi:hypothetical protein
MMKLNLLSAALITAALLMTPAMARESQATSQRVPRQARLVRPGKPAAIIAQGICLVLPIAMRGATGAPITGPWFTLIRSKQSPEARETSAWTRLDPVCQLFIPSRAPELGQKHQRKNKP